MADIDSVLEKDTDFTFEEAVAYFMSKIPVTPSQFRQIANQYKSLAFTVGGYTQIQILKRFYDELLAAIENGTTEAQFRQTMNGFLEAEGYEGLTPFQCDNTFRTNVQTAYQVGHYEQMTEPEAMRLRPYWQYHAVGDEATRPSHLAMNGKVFPADSPVWDTWYPPNGFRCRCTVTSLSRRQVEERGIRVETDAPRAEVLADGRFTHVLPDPSFSTNPAKTRFTPNLEGFPETLVNAYWARQSGADT